MPSVIRSCLGGLMSALRSARRAGGPAEESTRLLSSNAVKESEAKSSTQLCIGSPQTENGTTAQLNVGEYSKRIKPGKIFKIKSARSETSISWSRTGVQWLHVDSCGLTLVDAKGDDQPILWPYQCLSLYGYSRDSFRLIVTSHSSSAALSHFTFKTAPGVGRAVFACVQKQVESASRALRKRAAAGGGGRCEEKRSVSVGAATSRTQ